MRDPHQISHPRARRAVRLCAAVIGLLAAVNTAAQTRDFPAVSPFTGTLKKIYEGGVIRVGHRENSPPFAFLDANRRPIGYSLDICEVVVDEVAQHVRKDIKVEYVPVTPANRFDLVSSGAVDLECGSTTASTERRAIVAFSPTTFVTGTKLLVKRGSGIRSLSALQGKTVVLTRGTIQADVIPKLAQRQQLAIQFIFGNDHNESFQAVATDKARGLRQRRRAAARHDRVRERCRRLPGRRRVPDVRRLRAHAAT